MQQIERYGVIALVLLLVTIVAVSFWGGDAEGGLWSRLTGRGKAAASAPARAPAVAAESTRRIMGPDLPHSEPLEVPLRAPPAPGAAAGSARPETSETVVAPQAGPGPHARRRGAREMQPASADGAAAEPGWKSAVRDMGQELRGVGRELAEWLPDAPPTTGGAREASAAPERSTESRPAARVYVVRAGDSLGEIAQKELGSASRWKEIQERNGGIDPARLHVGMKLELPGRADALADRLAAEPPRSAPAARPDPALAEKARVPEAKPRVNGGGAPHATHTVRGGETLSEIAAQRLGSAARWQEIALLNPGVDPGRLHVGQVLKLPGGAPTASAVIADARPAAPAASRPSAPSVPASSQPPRVR